MSSARYAFLPLLVLAAALPGHPGHGQEGPLHYLLSLDHLTVIAGLVVLGLVVGGLLVWRRQRAGRG